MANHIDKWMKFFEQVSCLYQGGMRYLWNNKYPDHATDIWDSLAIFLEGYAFERQGRKPDYSHAAVDTVNAYRRDDRSIQKKDNNRIWERFSNSLNNRKLNKKNNPLCRIHGRKLSLVDVVLKYEMANSTFSEFLKNSIEQEKTVLNAHKVLCEEIRGIGTKIASFYLRDLVAVTKINLSETDYRHLLQPVDIWVRRVVTNIQRNPKIKDGKIPDFIVTNSEQPELVNMGMWYFGSQIAACEYRLKKALTESNGLEYAESLVDDYKTSLSNKVREYDACVADRKRLI